MQWAQPRKITSLRVPLDIAAWLTSYAADNRLSENEVIVRCLREKMDREAVKEGA